MAILKYRSVTSINPNGVLVNSKSPKGVVIAVFYIFLGYRNLVVSFNQYSFVKIPVPCKPMAKSCKCGIWYLSGTVFTLRFLKSPQGHHAPVSGFCTICNGEEYGLLGRTYDVPNCNKCWNSSFAILYFSGCSLRSNAWVDGPVVVI